MGCLFSVDSDAHAPGQLDFLDHGAARVAALAGYVVIVERNQGFRPDGGWPDRFESVHSLGMFFGMPLL